ncbi:unnamed protein product [Chondrus crispus]|uniref:C-terminal processing peptidase n=1 Tax=Chondrus crispus TaxID=2769 RepID=R7QML3_CHOCR|nr:unnamed protein product [Chondrus crispus]CDF39757.1 unnamed protein product [Chondrus crispus]|eukprot:XP_005710051.1 unnamed protein product [Chondrus crispus]
MAAHHAPPTTLAFSAALPLPRPASCAPTTQSPRNAVPQCSNHLPSPLQMARIARSVTAGALSGALVALTLAAPASALTEPQKLVAEAWRVVDQSYVDRTFNHQDWFSVRMRTVKRAYASVDEGYSAIRDMLALLSDPYTRFLSPQQFTSLTSSATGEVAGVGVELFPTRVDGVLKVTSPVDDSPAGRAGVKSNDVIMLIDGEATDDLSPDEAAQRIRGRPGTSISLTVVHDEGKGTEESFEMVRENLKLKSIKAKWLGPGQLYVKIKQFNSSTASDLKDALQSFTKEDIEKIVLDLRNNPGGYFPAGVDVARLFIKSGTPIVYVVDKNGVQDEIDTVGDGLYTEQPMIVLVNKATASASEILAGALKDNERAKLIGEQTFGKGVVQTISQLSDGSGVAVTIARYETPNHIDINKIGIAPNVKIPCKLDADVKTCLPTEAW